MAKGRVRDRKRQANVSSFSEAREREVGVTEYKYIPETADQ